MNPVALSPDQREAALSAMESTELDILVVGGGVVGAGSALDAATRGLDVGLVEARDYASGTSSRSSKLIHGGLRYLEMLDFALVAEALQERGLLIQRLAPHLVRPVSFVYPLHGRVWERVYAGTGVALYDTLGMLSGNARGLPHHRHLTRKHALRIVPSLRKDSLIGALQYYDAQVDDARHTMFVARTAAAYGAHVASRARVVEFLREGERVCGAVVQDLESGRTLQVRARQVVNSTGVWTDDTQSLVGRARAVPRPRQQGRAPRGPPRPDPLRVGADPAHREVGAVRDPVGPALDRRHHRHRLEPRQGAPGGQRAGHRLRPRARQPGAADTADPHRRRGRVRRPATAAEGRDRGQLEAVARARRRARRARPRRGGRREVHHLPGDGPGRRRRGGARPRALPRPPRTRRR